MDKMSTKKNTFRQSGTQKSITKQVERLFKSQNVTYEVVGFGYDSYNKKTNGDRGWNVKDFDRIIDFFAKRGVDLQLRFALKEDIDSPAKKGNIMSLKNEIEKLKIENRILQAKIEGMLQITQAQHNQPPFPNGQGGKTG